MMRLLVSLAFLLATSAQAGPPYPMGGKAAFGGGGGGLGDGSGQGANGLEKLADSITANVFCSEPLAGTDTNTPDAWNPNDTQSGSTHECTDLKADWFDTEDPTNSYDIDTAPDGKKSLRIDPSGDILWMLVPDATSSARRACIRYYKWVDTDYDGAGTFGTGCRVERNKVSQFGFGAQVSQITENEFAGCPTPPTEYGPLVVMYTGGDSSSGHTDRWGACNAGWCRFEHCVSGTIDAGGSMTFESRMWSEETGTTSSRSVGPYTVPAQSGDTGGDFFRQAGGGGGVRGTSWIKNFFYAEWNTDSGQWIGAACEVEGGC